MRPTTVFLLLLLSACATSDPAPRNVLDARVPSADGVLLAYDAYALRGPETPVLVFVHGWCCDRQHWRNQVEALVPSWPVVTLDLAGHGASAANRDSWSIDAFAGDVQSVVNAIGAKRIVLIGHSMGGPVCLAAAARMPEQVVAVIGVDTIKDVDFEMPKESYAKVIAGFRADFDGTMRGMIGQLIAPGGPAGLESWIAERALRTDHAGALKTIDVFPDLDQKALLRGVRVPVRCINAAVGPASPMPTVVSTNRKYADFDAVIMDGVGHYPMLERPGEFTARLLALLSDLHLASEPR